MLGLPLGGGPYTNSSRLWNIVHSMACKNSCRLFIHDYCFGPLGLHLLVWSELGRSWPFWPMRDLKLHWLHVFNPVWEMAMCLSSRHLRSKLNYSLYKPHFQTQDWTRAWCLVSQIGWSVSPRVGTDEILVGSGKFRKLVQDSLEDYHGFYSPLASWASPYFLSP